MICINYVVRQGDTLYTIAEEYRTSVQMILALNPGLDANRLNAGMRILVCPDETYINPIGRPRPKPREQPQPNPCDPPMPAVLADRMRRVWLQHVYWTRLLLVSIAGRLEDQEATTARLMHNPKDIADIFARYYPQQAADAIERLLSEHLQLGAELMAATRDGQTARASELDRRWYKNADAIAAALSRMDPDYKTESLRRMLYSHLDLTKREIVSRVAGNFPADISAFNDVEREVLSMADYLTAGILK